MFRLSGTTRYLSYLPRKWPRCLNEISSSGVSSTLLCIGTTTATVFDACLTEKSVLLVIFGLPSLTLLTPKSLFGGEVRAHRDIVSIHLMGRVGRDEAVDNGGDLQAS